MKNITYFIVFSLIAVSCIQPNKSVIKGEIIGADQNEIAYLNQLTSKGIVNIDSTSLRKNGSFKFHLNLDNPRFYQLELLSGQSVTLAIMPGERINLTANFDDFYASKQITGSPNTIRINTLHDSLRQTVAQLKEIERVYSGTDSLNQNNNHLKDSLSQVYLSIRAKHHKYSTGFILEDLKSLANVAALYQQYSPDNYVFHAATDLQFFKLATDTLSKYYPNVTMVKRLQSNYKLMLGSYNTKQLLEKTAPKEVGIHNFKLPNTDGAIQTMLSPKNKLLLLSFWSINDETCLKNNMALKSIYKKYKHAGFEIYHVAINPNPEQWKKTIHFEDYDWINVYDTAYPNSASLSFYNVTEVPMNYLIDVNKEEILGKNLQPKALDNALNYQLN